MNVFQLNILLVLLLFTSCKSSEKNLQPSDFIIEKGKARAEIIISDNPTRSVKIAANELQGHLQKMTGARLNILRNPSGKQPNLIFIGKSKHADKVFNPKRNFSEGEFVIKSDKNFLILRGNDNDFIPKEPFAKSRGDIPQMMEEWDKITKNYWDNPLKNTFKSYQKSLDIWEHDEKGSLNAVYEFLRMQGVRWYMPGEIGEVIPQKKNIELPSINKKSKPDFVMRNFGFYGKRFFQCSEEEALWQLRLGLNKGASIKGVGPLGHGTSYVHSRDEIKKRHLDYFGVFNGKRDTESRRHGKPCLSSQGLINENILFARKYFDTYRDKALSVMPADAYGKICECNLCKRKGSSNKKFEGSMSDYVWHYVNEVAKEVYKTHPDKKITCMAYGSYLLPPSKIRKLSPNIIVGITRKRSHFELDGNKDFYEKLQNDWSRLSSNKIIMWDYYLYSRKNDKFRGVPVVFTDLIQEDLKNLKGISYGEFIEIFRESDDSLLGLAINHLNIYVTAQLLWDADQNLNALLDDYYVKFYNEASEEMKRFFEFSENNWTSITTNSNAISQLFSILSSAKKKAKCISTKNRINLIAKYIEPLSHLQNTLQVRREEKNIAKAIWKNDKNLRFDGLLNEPYWEGLPKYQLSPQGKTDEGKKNEITTTYSSTRSINSIYFGINCTIPSEYKSVNDNIELLIENEIGNLFHLVINSRNQKIEFKNFPIKKNNIKYAFNKNRNGWSVEIKLPTEKNGLFPNLPTKSFPWYFNMRRNISISSHEFSFVINPNNKLDFFDSKGFSTFFIK